MNLSRIIVTLSITFSCCALCSAQTRSISDLEVILGTWEVEEKHPNGWWERGERTCALVMDGSYIECQTKAKSSNGNTRTYRFLINYNEAARQFEMVGIYSNWSSKQLDAILPDSTGMNWQLKSLPLAGDKSVRTANIIFHDRNSYTWSGKNTNESKGTLTTYTEKGRRKNIPSDR